MFTDEEIAIMKSLLDKAWKTKPMQALYAKLEQMPTKEVCCSTYEEYVAKHQPALAAAQEESRVRQLEDALEAMVGYENGPCSFDHHGYCQDHPGNHEPGKCALAHGRKLLGIEPGALERKR